MTIDPQVMELLTKHQYVINAYVQKRPLQCTVKYPERVDFPVYKACTSRYTLKYPNTIQHYVENADVNTQNTYDFPTYAIRPYVHFDILISCLIAAHNFELIVPHINDHIVPYEDLMDTLRWKRADKHINAIEDRLMDLMHEQLPHGLPDIDEDVCSNADVIYAYNQLRSLFVKPPEENDV